MTLASTDSDGKRERGRRHDARRRALKPWRALYYSTRWLKMKRAHLAHNPLCERCKVQGKVTAATVVHHKKKHEGNEILFFDPANLASSCAPCHDSIEQQIEKRGYSMAIGADGWPIDPNHPSNG